MRVLKHKLDLQKESSLQDDFGSVSSSNWETLRSFRASITPISGNEKFLSNTAFAQVTHKIVCRYRNDINASLRLSFDDREDTRIFRIISAVNIEEKKRYLEIRATEEIND